MTSRRSTVSGSNPLTQFGRRSKRRGIGIVRTMISSPELGADSNAAPTKRTLTCDVDVRGSVARLRGWVLGEALPLWGETGFDSARGSFVERLTFEGAPLLS